MAGTAHLTPFERRVIQIVNYLDETKHEHQKFRHKKDLLAKLFIKNTDWGKYTGGLRNIPDTLEDKPTGKHKHIRQYLINEFDVNPAWLDRGQEPMILGKPSYSLQDENISYSKISLDRYQAMQRELTLKDELINELRGTIKIQNDLITHLKTSQNTSQALLPEENTTYKNKGK